MLGFVRNLRSTLWPQKPARVLAEAARLQRTQSLEAALAYLRSKGAAAQQPVAHLLRANDAPSDDAWQSHLNAYLSLYGVAPLHLSPGPQKRFHRLACNLQEVVNEGPLISVIMTTFNAERTVDHAVCSILRQTWRPVELLIVDDASQDTTWQRLQALAQRDDRIRLFKNCENVGPYVSKNIALSAANGQYVTCQDADDWAHPQRLELQVAALKAHPGAVANAALCLRATEDLQFRKTGGIGSNETDGVAHIALITSFYETSVFREKIGHWDSVRFGADHELFRRARALLGQDFRIAGEVTSIVLDAEGSLTNDPVHGTRAGPRNGLSPTRVTYKENWEAWHRRAVPGGTYLEFPHSPRKFEAPAAMLPDPEALARVMAASAAARQPQE